MLQHMIAYWSNHMLLQMILHLPEQIIMEFLASVSIHKRKVSSGDGPSTVSISTQIFVTISISAVINFLLICRSQFTVILLLSEDILFVGYSLPYIVRTPARIMYYRTYQFPLTCISRSRFISDH